MRDIILFQTADPIGYRRMLQATSRTTIEFCRRHGHRYESYIGIKRGWHPWQATFNRIVQLRELLDRGFEGWAVHLDADAYIHDLDFDLTAYLADKSDAAAVLTPSGASDRPWDINAGVALINLGNPLGRALAGKWHAAFMRLTDAWLEQQVQWPESDNDQHLLFKILDNTPAIVRSIHFESPDLINSMNARFIRQHLRAYVPSLEERTRSIELLVETLLGPENGEDIVGTVAPAVVAACYRSVLHRDPDRDGLLHYAQHLRTVGIERGTSDMLGFLLNGEEARALSASRT